MNGFEAIREIYNLTLEDIANILNMTKQGVSMWMTKERKIPQKRIIELSEKLLIPPAYFSIEEVTDNIKSEIKQYKIRKEIADNMFEKEFEKSLFSLKQFEFNQGLIEHMELSESKDQADNLLKNIKGLISGYKPEFEEENGFNEFINYQKRIICSLEQFTKILKDNRQIEMIEFIIKALDLFFTDDIKNNLMCDEDTNFLSDLAKNENELVQNMIKVLQKHYSKLGEKKNKEQKIAELFLD